MDAGKLAQPGTPIKDLETPRFLVDIKRLKENASKYREFYESINMKLRVHVKSHKCLSIADIQTAGTKRCICTSTLAEAEYFANDGYDDILLATTFTEDKLSRMVKLAGRLDQFHVMVDSDCGIEILEKNPLPQKPWSVFLKLDCGFKRAGTEWDDPYTLELGRKIYDSKNMTLFGLYTFDGNAYNYRCADETVNRTMEVFCKLEKMGISCPTISIGSTPTGCSPSESIKKATEIHMVSYIFFDYHNLITGSCKPENMAAKVMMRIKGHYPKKGTMLIDCGYTAFGLVGLGQFEDGGMAMVENHPELVVYKMCQEIGFVRAKDSKTLEYDIYPIGSILFLYPYHSCATAAQHREYIAHEDGILSCVWTTCSQQ